MNLPDSDENHNESWSFVRLAPRYSQRIFIFFIFWIVLKITFIACCRRSLCSLHAETIFYFLPLANERPKKPIVCPGKTEIEVIREQ